MSEQIKIEYEKKTVTITDTPGGVFFVVRYPNGDRITINMSPKQFMRRMGING